LSIISADYALDTPERAGSSSRCFLCLIQCIIVTFHLRLRTSGGLSRAAAAVAEAATKPSPLLAVAEPVTVLVVRQSVERI
jgi:hypothetical protein